MNYICIGVLLILSCMLTNSCIFSPDYMGNDKANIYNIWLHKKISFYGDTLAFDYYEFKKNKVIYLYSNFEEKLQDSVCTFSFNGEHLYLTGLNIFDGGQVQNDGWAVDNHTDYSIRFKQDGKFRELIIPHGYR